MPATPAGNVNSQIVLSMLKQVVQTQLQPVSDSPGRPGRSRQQMMDAELIPVGLRFQAC